VVIWGFILDLFLFGSGAPIFIAFGLGSAIVLLCHFDMSVTVLSQVMFKSIGAFVLLAVPLFIFAGNLMLQGGSSRRLLNAIDSFTGHLPGGMLVSTVLACAFFAALSGSGGATIAAIGTIMYPVMMDKGYGERLSTGVISVAGTLGNLIPPSIFFVMYGAVTETSVARLLAAGLVPGLVATVIIGTLGVVMCIRRGVALRPPSSWGERFTSLWKGLGALFMPIFILGGIYGGIFTPTEAAAVACVYAIVIGVVAHRELTWTGVKVSAASAIRSTSMIFVLLAAIALMNQVLVFSGISQTITKAIVGLGLGQVGLLLMIDAFLIAITFFVEPFALMFVVMPILAPVCNAMGISLILVGVLFCMCALIGQITPPMGLLLYFTARITKVPAEEIIRGALPFLGAMTLATLIVTFFPALALWLPSIIIVK